MSFCRFCGTPLLPQASICSQCQRPLQTIDKTPPTDFKNVPQASQPVPDTAYLVIEPQQPTLAQYKTEMAEQQRALARLRQDMQEQLEQQQLALKAQQREVTNQLAKKVDKVETTATGLPNLAVWKKRTIGIFLILSSLIFLGSFALILLYSKPTHRIDSLTLLSTALVVFGGFYLAYDLLGRQNGPLVWLTAYITYAMIGILGGSVASFLIIAKAMTTVSPNVVFQNLSIDPATLTVPSGRYIFAQLPGMASFCLLSGALIGIAGNLLTRPYKSSRLSWHQAFLLDLLFCFGFWVLFFALFSLALLPVEGVANFGELFSIVFLAPIVLTYFTVFFVRLYRFVIVQKLSSDRPDDRSNMILSHRRHQAFLLDLGFWFCFWAPLFASGYLSSYFRGDSTLVNNALANNSIVTNLLDFIFTPIVPAFITILFVRLYRFIIIHKRSGNHPDDRQNMKIHHPLGYWTIFIISTLLIFSIPTALPLLIVFLASSTTNIPIPTRIVEALIIILGFALSGTLPPIFAPFTVNWINSLGERRLGGTGLALASLGTLLAVIPTLLDLFAK